MQEDRRQLRRTFDSAASLYDSQRPGYPEALIQDIILLSQIPRGGDILEIGCGTGQATEPFAQDGYHITCLELGTHLADVARHKFHSNGNVTIISKPFESWDPTDQQYDLVIAATSFHWIDPEVRFIKAAQLLRPSAALAVFTNQHIRKNEGFFARVQDIYRRHAPALCQTKAEVDQSAQLEPGIDLFEQPIIKRYLWEMRYTADEYVALLGTYSNHIALPEPQREELFHAIIQLIRDNFSGSVIKHYESELLLRKKIARTTGSSVP